MADKTSAHITIAAPRPAVLAVIADFEAYPEWAGGVKSAEVVQPGTGPGPGGRPAQVRFTLDAGMIRDSYVLAYEWDGDDQVRWTLAEAGAMISGLSGAYLLAGQDAGTEDASTQDASTDVTYELAVSLKVPMPGLLKRRAEKMIIDTALKGLRSRAERA